jgi:inosine-uridine nucleoside N-ribohydrolase
MIKTIIDTDGGYDDLLALALAINSKKLEILAITIVAGNCQVETATKNVCSLLSLLNSEIPVYIGSKKPLKKRLATSSINNKKIILSNQIYPFVNKSAVDKIVELVKKNPGKITILALGPLTNIAKSIIKNPDVMNKVKEIDIMGGAINVPGNQNKYLEFNFFVDPKAVDVVINFSIKKVLIPLDVCNKAVIQKKDISKRLLKAKILELLKEYYFRCLNNKLPGAIMYDPLAVYYLMNKSSFSIKNMKKYPKTYFTNNFNLKKFKRDFIYCLSNKNLNKSRKTKLIIKKKCDGWLK